MVPDPTAHAPGPFDVLAGARDGHVERFVPELFRGALIEAEHLARYRWASAMADGRRVLDAGCGMAYGTRILAEAGALSVLGVDRERRVLDAADLSGLDGIVRLEQGDVLALPLPDDAVDLVVCFEVLEHVPDPLAALDELARVLAPGGVLMASTPNRGVYLAGNPFHVHELTLDEFSEALRARFEHVAVSRQDSWLATTIRPLQEEAAGALLAAPSSSAAADRAPTYVVSVASDQPVEPPSGMGLLAGIADWQHWSDLTDHLRAENVRLGARADALARAAGERDELRRALLDAEQLLADRADLEADLRDAEAEIEQLIAHLRERDAAA
jgi:SAM-dependent methyltransferase